MTTKYFVTKCDNIGRLYAAKETSVWACCDRRTPPQPRDTLSEAFDQGPVILIFSVNNCHGWHGYATMLSKPCHVEDISPDASKPGEEGRGTSVSAIICQENEVKAEADPTSATVCDACACDVTGDDVTGGYNTVCDATVCDATVCDATVCDATVCDATVCNATTSDCTDDKTCNAKAHGGHTADSNLIEMKDLKNPATIVWHKFKIRWERLYLKEHSESCLPFSWTTSLYVNDTGLLLNKARNLQEISEITGKAVCDMINQHYEQLCHSQRQKVDEKRLKLGDSFFEPGSEKDPLLIWARLLSKVKDMGTVILACAFGSQRYNLHTPTSDMDMFIVYAAETKDVLGFEPPKQTIKNRDTDTCDYTIHEIHRYCELLLSGDPRCVETLFLHPLAVYMASEEWLQLCSHKKKFLTKTCLDKYLRDATGAKGLIQLNKWKAAGIADQVPLPAKVYKLLYIVIRLLQNAKQIASCEDLRVYREANSPERQLLMSVREGSVSFSYLQQHVDCLLSEIAELQEQNKSKIRETTNHVKQVVECWLLLIRYRSLGSYMRDKL